ncbi:MAG: DUF995 domain-containing protein [Mesorhizobium sp.]|nr:MAG: DUF995 domain-containing protein [Mesorhizobium sp.]RWP21043.1 MAG: DUF995 domain-containing protein [Mesorhizobium sp.]TIL29464.1 MAG: DUF995 domain-containing protein [Mesorhizobium sp.]TIM42938.1 MAG: DUF995 domain-containing protein [Mesorhizobium sp.]
MKKWRYVVSLALAGGIALAAVEASAEQYAKSQLGSPLTTDELFQVYQGRSWIWKDGAGHFSPRQRRFTATTGNGTSYGEGRWFLTDPGKLCFRATWTSKDGSTPALSCFSHRKQGANVYQKSKKGKWYLFKHAQLRKTDEYAKVRRGDYVANRLAKTKARLANR